MARRPRRGVDALVGLGYLAMSLWVTLAVWRDIDGLFLGSRAGDQLFNEWMIANNAHTVTDPGNPFFTTLQNAPDGVNLMTNVGLQLLGLLLSPVTLLAGATFSYLLLMTLNLAGTAFAWYWVLSRHLVSSRWAAVVGGLFLGFAPAMISQTNGHPHVTAQWLVPFIVLRVIKLTRPGPVLRDGLILGGLVAVQFFLGLEILFLTALGSAVALFAYAVLRWRDTVRALPKALATLGVAGLVVLAFAAYPMWMQFFGPQHRTGHPGAGNYSLRVGSYVHHASQSLAGSVAGARPFTPNTTEETSFYGWPLVLLAVAAVLWLRRELGVRVLAVTAVIAAAFSLGPVVAWAHFTGPRFPGPFALVEHVPVMDAVVPARFALITTVMLGILLALAVDRVLALPPRRIAGVPLRVACGVTLGAALLLVAPTPLDTTPRPAIPHYITSGGWRAHVAEGHTLVPVPVDNLRSINWGAAALAGFAVPQGYFLGPTSEQDSTGRWGVEPRPTAALLTAVAKGERPSAVTDAERAQAVADVRFWKADALVLPQAEPAAAGLRAALDALYGPGVAVDDVWVWDVRPLGAGA